MQRREGEGIVIAIATASAIAIDIAPYNFTSSLFPNMRSKHALHFLAIARAHFGIPLGIPPLAKWNTM